jgi:hypothetical protein
MKRDLDRERMERIDATARTLFAAVGPTGQSLSTEGEAGADTAYEWAACLEDARVRFVARGTNR